MEVVCKMEWYVGRSEVGYLFVQEHSFVCVHTLRMDKVCLFVKMDSFVCVRMCAYLYTAPNVAIVVCCVEYN